MKIRKDNKVNSLAKSRKLYWILLVFLIVYLFLDDGIINEPNSFVLARWVLAFGIIITFCISRFKRFREYYFRKIKDWKYLIFSTLVLLLSFILLQAILSIPFNFAIKIYSQNSEIEYQRCPIKNVITTGIDKVHFTFLNQTYSRYFETAGHTREELINNYNLIIGIKKSIANTYYLESIELEEK